MTGHAVPAYFHPAREVGDWDRLHAAAQLGIVVVNPASGVGPAPDAAYRDACTALRRRPGVVVAGYVDSGYAQRPLREVLDEAHAYRSYYGIEAVFVDQVTSGKEPVRHYRRLAACLRGRGFGPIVLNPGVTPDADYRTIADVVVTFEGPWSAYRDRRVPDARGPGRTWHLVHDTPADEHRRAWLRARQLGAGYAYVTERRMPNPWEGVASGWPPPVGAGAA